MEDENIFLLLPGVTRIGYTELLLSVYPDFVALLLFRLIFDPPFWGVGALTPPIAPPKFFGFA